MRSPIRLYGLFATLLIAGASAGQSPTVGTLSNADSFSVQGPATAIDLTHPVSANGDLTTATVIWNGGGFPCGAAVKIKIFRPLPNGALTLVGERGPFDVSPGTLTFNLSPPIPVHAGDRIGVAQLKLALDCGGAQFSADASGIHTVLLAGDAGGTVTLCDDGAVTFFESISVQASGQSETYGGTITGVGSANGAAGSNFKTAMQLLNTGLATSRGRLVFHPIGVSGSASDPSLSYTLASGESKSFDDVVAAIGTTGLGSIDVMTQSSPVPLIVTRVFNDAGAGGTAGFSEPLVHPDDPSVLQAGDDLDTVFFIAPPDLSRYRVNLGVRSFSQGVKLSVLAATPGGSSGSTTRTYEPNFFDQRSASDFVGVTVGGGAVVEIRVLKGSAVVYMVTVDNKTNDTAIQFGDRRRS